MKLDFINLKDLTISPLNVRKHGAVNGDDLIPSIKANGVIQPLLVRPTRGEEDDSPTGKQNSARYEIIAGQRRYMAALEIADAATEAQAAAPDGVDLTKLPCAIMEADDDAKAIEASLAENIARLPMDEIDQYEAFLSLSRCGQTVNDIANHFGVTTRLVEQRLAIANLYPPILNAYRREEIEPPVIRLLTMATTKKQKEWFKLFKQEEEPRLWQLKGWLFGGDEIPTDNALFDLKDYKGVITSDLFGDDSYFADSSLFWEHQSKAIADIKTDLEEDGWQDVVLLDVGQSWLSWEHQPCSKEKGGKVFIEVKQDGEVIIHEGLIHEKEAKRLERLEQQAKNGNDAESTVPSRPELTKAMQNYLNLHRHAAVRTEILKAQGSALRLCVAQIIAGSELWDIHADAQKANTDAIKDSLAHNKAEDIFAEERKAIRKLLGIKGDNKATLVPRKEDWGKSHDLETVFAKLMGLDDETVMRILTVLVAETLPSGSAMVETLGEQLCVSMADHWDVRDEGTHTTFLDLLKDKEAINAMLQEVVGKNAAKGNITETAKVQKQIIKDVLTGKREPHADAIPTEAWLPRYMRFPMQDYAGRSGLVTPPNNAETPKAA